MLKTENSKLKTEISKLTHNFSLFMGYSENKIRGIKMNELNMSMLADFYEFTMSNGYFKNGFYKKNTYFDVFFRSVPDGGGFAIAAGLEPVIEYIKNQLEHHKFVSYEDEMMKICVNEGADFFET